MQKPVSLSEVQRRVIQFFHEHPHAVETVRGIATWIACEPKLIEEALEGLVGRKWLSADETSAVRGYSLTRDERFLTQIQDLMEPS